MTTVRLREGKYLLRVTQQGMGKAEMGTLGFYLPAQERSLCPPPSVRPAARVGEQKCLGHLPLTVWGLIRTEQRTMSQEGRGLAGSLWLQAAPLGQDRCEVVGELSDPQGRPWQKGCRDRSGPPGVVAEVGLRCRC